MHIVSIVSKVKRVFLIYKNTENHVK